MSDDTKHMQYNMCNTQANSLQESSRANDGLRTCVLCVGNVLLADEGLGSEVAKQLNEHYEFPPNVEVLDCATLGLGLLPFFRDCNLVVIVDAVDNTGLEVGTIVRFAPDDIQKRTNLPSAHDTSIADILQAAELLEYNPKVLCIGVQVENINPDIFTIGLTDAVEAVVPRVCDVVIEALVNNGVVGITGKN